jgi:hypothetical protein
VAQEILSATDKFLAILGIFHPHPHHLLLVGGWCQLDNFCSFPPLAALSLLAHHSQVDLLVLHHNEDTQSPFFFFKNKQ